MIEKGMSCAAECGSIVTVELDYELPVSGSFAGWVWQNQQPVLFENIESVSDFLHLWRSGGSAALLELRLSETLVILPTVRQMLKIRQFSSMFPRKHFRNLRLVSPLLTFLPVPYRGKPAIERRR